MDAKVAKLLQVKITAEKISLAYSFLFGLFVGGIFVGLLTVLVHVLGLTELVGLLNGK
jgi:hypothetical protein